MRPEAKTIPIVHPRDLETLREGGHWFRVIGAPGWQYNSLTDGTKFASGIGYYHCGTQTSPMRVGERPGGVSPDDVMFGCIRCDSMLIASWDQEPGRISYLIEGKRYEEAEEASQAESGPATTQEEASAHEAREDEARAPAREGVPGERGSLRGGGPLGVKRPLQQGQRVEVQFVGSDDRWYRAVYLGPASEAVKRPGRTMFAVDTGEQWVVVMQTQVEKWRRRA